MSDTGHIEKPDTTTVTDAMGPPHYVHVEYPPEHRPYRCPICNGKGIVPNGFYLGVASTWSGTSVAPETCRACGGSGIVWG